MTDTKGYKKRTNEKGEVAVLYSPGYGAGWSTWNEEHADVERLIFDADLVDLVLAERRDEAAKLAESFWPGEYVCVLGARDLAVAWVPAGELFDIDEYDGYENVVLVKSLKHYTA